VDNIRDGTFRIPLGVSRTRFEASEAECQALSSLEIDDQLESCGLHNRQFGGLGAFEDSSSIDAGLMIRVAQRCPVAHESAGGDVFALKGNGGNRMPRRELPDLPALPQQERIYGDEQGVASPTPRISRRRSWAMIRSSGGVSVSRSSAARATVVEAPEVERRNPLFCAAYHRLGS
jgi:hypothetical protein